MKVTVSVVAEVEDGKAADKLRDVMRATVEEELDQPVSAMWSTNEQPFTVVGTTRGKPDEPWRVVVDAENAEEAKRKAVEEDKTRAVAAVLPGEPKAEGPPPA